MSDYSFRKKQLAYTYQSRSFVGLIKLVDGKKQLSLNAPTYYRQELNNFEVGERVSLIVTRKRPKRTLAQNAYLWGAYYPLILKEGFGSGNLLDTHEDFARRHLTIREFTNSKGQICYSRKSTADLTVGEFCGYIADIYGDTGIMPPPTEEFGLDRMKSFPQIDTGKEEKVI